jgi:NAD(P)-dependent dehydrogenase (short-subunit alcohol dehydrogenase family)
MAMRYVSASLPVALLMCFAVHAAAPAPAGAKSAAPVALITGSDRGIGFALTQEFASRGWKVIATCRDPGRANQLQEFASSHHEVTVELLDVADDAAIDALAAKYAGKPIDALINNAGIVGDLDSQHVGTFNATGFEQVMRVNSYAPLRVSQAFLENVAASRQKKIVAISSGSGSLWMAQQTRAYYYYNMSKSALNMGMRILQNEVRDRGILVGIVSPGPVDTDMQREYRAAAAKANTPITTPALSPEDSARALVTYVETLSTDKAGRFYSYNGQEIPW